MERGGLVQQGVKQPSDVGCHGISCISAALPYVDASTIWVLPPGHMLLHGIGKGLWKCLLLTVARGQPRPAYVLSNDVRRVLQARTQEIDVTGDYGRRPQ